MAETQSFEFLKTKRKSLRTAVNKIVNELEAELSNSDLNVDRLCELVEILCFKFEPLTLVHQQMEPLFKPEEFDVEFEITERYREKVLLWKIGVISDIRKAFLQISLHENDMNYLPFLWWEGGNSEKAVIYRHRRVVFGVSWFSPFLLAAVLNHHFKQAPEHLEKAAEKLKDSMYVDNCVASADSSEELESFQRDSTELLALDKFDLRGWRNSDI
ncbi:integrase catalytic domain-containing protein [Trichonephila clavipes]|nr:integrase catalytic domain-containing protein [Trichonephila clavipes]